MCASFQLILLAYCNQSNYPKSIFEFQHRYLIVKIKGRQWKAHRLAWVKYYGSVPTFNIDHINGDRLDNRIINLRDVPQAVNNNNANRRPNQNTGVIGVHISDMLGLLAKYTVKYRKKSYRFRSLYEAIQFRKQRGLKV